MHRFHFHREAAHSPDRRGHSGHEFAHEFVRHAMGRHGGMGRRRGRVFDQGDLRYVLLQLIADKPSHGYELIKDIEERLGGAYSPSPGVVYPTLTLLEEMGYAQVAQSDGPKKAYAITPEGLAVLEANKASVEAILQRMSAIAERRGGGLAPQIVRALENLNVALRLRMERGKLTDQQIADVAAALDAAAATVERD